MPYMGSLKRGVATQITISGASTNSGPTASHVQKVLKVALLSSEIFELDIMASCVVGASTTVSSTFGNNITRVVIAVYPPPNGGAKVKIEQGAAINDEVVVQGDGQVVYDIVT
jgi:hypothetical protein